MRQPRYRSTIRAGRVDQLPDRQLHAIYGRMQREWEDTGELSKRQNWLWDRVGEELARRWYAARHDRRCLCQFCATSVEVQRQFEPF